MLRLDLAGLEEPAMVMKRTADGKLTRMTTLPSRGSTAGGGFLAPSGNLVRGASRGAVPAEKASTGPATSETGEPKE